MPGVQRWPGLTRTTRSRTVRHCAHNIIIYDGIRDVQSMNAIRDGGTVATRNLGRKSTAVTAGSRLPMIDCTSCEAVAFLK